MCVTISHNAGESGGHVQHPHPDLQGAGEDQEHAKKK